MSSSENERKEERGDGIRRLIASDANARYLRALPLFGVEAVLPADLRLLLRAIDRSELQPPRAGVEANRSPDSSPDD